jgi:cell division transport system permease protein
MTAPREAEAALPRAAGAGTALLVSIIALMTWLALLALGASVALGAIARERQAGLAGRWTVEIAPDTSGRGKPADQRARDAAQALRGVPGVVRAEPLSRDEIRRLLSPWLGNEAVVDELPLPGLVDVAVDPQKPPALDAIRKRLAEVPGATLDDHRSWVVEIVRLTRAAEAVAIAVFIVVGAIALLAIVAAARARLAIHAHEVELLHVIGAADRWIARQFQASALAVALRGGLSGLILAVTTIAGVAWAFALPVDRLLPLLGPSWSIVAVALAVPAAAALAAMLAARWAAMRALRRLP